MLVITLSAVVEQTETKLRISITLFRSCSIPHFCHCEVFGNVATIAVEPAEEILRIDNALTGSASEPGD